MCSECLKAIQDKGEMFTEILKMILESFIILKRPVIIKGIFIIPSVIEYLERNKYIVTTEFPEGEEDAILAKPLGHILLEHTYPFFCFEHDKHQ
jgi:hypothetical protein